MEQETYPYKRLPTSKSGHRFIRILILHPRPAFETELKADLVDECLCQCSRTYEAVSYAWGTEDAVHTITIGGYRHSIRPNLYHCLQRLCPRLHSAPRRLWVDALCIDQSDNRERARQVALMRGIFANAESTIAWLGEHDPRDNAEHTFDILLSNSIETMSSVPMVRKSLEAREHITQLCDRRWFQRRWVVQEVAASRKHEIQLRLGEKTVDFKILSRFVQHIFSALPPETERKSRGLSIFAVEGEKVPESRTLCDATKSYHEEDGSSTDRAFVWRYFHANAVVLADGKGFKKEMAVEAVRVLDEFHDHECQDDRDRIAALSGLNGSMMFTVDYEATVEDNYVAFASAVAQNGGGFQLMRSALRRRDYSEERKLPSWVPDWRLPLYRHSNLSEILWTLSGKPAKIHVDGARLMLSVDAVRPLTDQELAYVDNWLSDIGKERNKWMSHRRKANSLLSVDLLEFGDPPCVMATVVLAFQGSRGGAFELLLELPSTISRASRARGIELDPELIDSDDNSLREILIATQKEYIYID